MPAATNMGYHTSFMYVICSYMNLVVLYTVHKYSPGVQHCFVSGLAMAPSGPFIGSCGYSSDQTSSQTSYWLEIAEQLLCPAKLMSGSMSDQRYSNRTQYVGASARNLGGSG